MSDTVFMQKALELASRGRMSTNPRVRGRGLKELRAAGIYTETAVMESEARELKNTSLRKNPLSFSK